MTEETMTEDQPLSGSADSLRKILEAWGLYDDMEPGKLPPDHPAAPTIKGPITKRGCLIFASTDDDNDKNLRILWQEATNGPFKIIEPPKQELKNHFIPGIDPHDYQ